MALLGETSADPDLCDDEDTKTPDVHPRCDRKETRDVADDAPSETETTRDAADETRRWGVWTLGEPFSDQAKVAAGLDRLGPFLLESDACPLPVMDPRRGPFDESDASEKETEVATATDIRGLQELQLNDVVDDASPLKPTTDEESIEEISDRLFEARDVEEDVEVDQHRSKRKRKEFVARERCNFVKHNLKNKRRKMRNKPRAIKKSRATAPLAKPIGQESIC